MRASFVWCNKDDRSFAMEGGDRRFAVEGDDTKNWFSSEPTNPDQSMMPLKEKEEEESREERWESRWIDFLFVPKFTKNLEF